jgi:UPF0755 protein
MKRLLQFFLFLGILAGIAAWLVLKSSTDFTSNTASIIIKEGKTDAKSVATSLKEEKIITSDFAFNLLANAAGIWKKVKPGKFEFKKGVSLLDIVRIFRNNKQAEAKLIITKLRTKQQLAKLLAKNFSFDSLTAIQFLSNNDSLSPFGVDTNTAMSLIIPDTYYFNWSVSMRRVVEKIADAQKRFWDKESRREKATALNMDIAQVYTLASIVEEETTKHDEKGNIASVYINRLNIGMPMGADPTVKFAVGDFSLKRILLVHTQVSSPYNTYRNKGLPPGPICTPSAITIDAVLNAPKTDYLYCCAKADFSGYHHFANNYPLHLKYAAEYQKALNELAAKKSKP